MYIIQVYEGIETWVSPFTNMLLSSCDMVMIKLLCLNFDLLTYIVWRKQT